jgi:signal transduction histidine kinase
VARAPLVTTLRAVTEPPEEEPGAPGEALGATGLPAGDRLLAHKERILARWEARMRKEIPAAAQQPHLILVNTLPEILEHLAQALSPRHPRRTATEGSTSATEHGGERVRLTHFRLEDLIGEYKLLRQVLFEVLEEEEPLTVEERHTLGASLDQAIMEACTGYALVQSGFRDQFFATVAHDLRSPLSAAQAGASLILRQPGSAQVPRWAARIIDNIGRVDRMVQDLLDAMRVETGARLPLELEECDLVEVVRNALEPLRIEHGDRFVLHAPEPVRGQVAPDALRRAVENLITNAVKYGDSRPITVAVRQAHERAILTVHNHGAHIPVEQQETLFRAFQRLATAETSGKRGWGLGLAQVRAVAEAHGGSIVVDSVAGRGTTFLIDIPLDARSFSSSPITPAVAASE